MNELAFQQRPDAGLRELALFAGAGGGILGGKLLGWRTVCAVELDQYCRDVLVARQNDGHIPPFPVWDDIRTFDGRPWRGAVDVVSGGFPCQDISAAGKGAGIDGARSGLWSEMARVVGEVGPRYVFVENSPILTSRGLGRVLGDLAKMGYDARWGVFSAADAIWLAGRPALDHLRERIFILASANAPSREQPVCGRTPRQGRHPLRNDLPTESGQDADAASEGSLPTAHAGIYSEEKSSRPRHEQPERCGRADADPNLPRLEVRQREPSDHEPERPTTERNGDGRGWWSTEPDVGRVAHGVANRVDRLKALGNGQVPTVVRLAWETLHGRALT